MAVVLIQMPSLSPTMEKGTIVKWHVKVGDEVASGQVLASIATDKATVDYESLDEGVIREVLIPEGNDGPVGQVIAVLTEEADEPYQDELANALENQQATATVSEEDGSGKEEPSPNREEVPAKNVKAPTDSGKSLNLKSVPVSPMPVNVSHPDPLFKQNAEFRVSPAARQEADLRQINLERVVPKGVDGRIILSDLDGLPNGFGMDSVKKSSGLIGYVNRNPEPGEKIPLSPMRAAIADRMVKAVTGVPTFFLETVVEMDRLLDLKAQLSALNDLKVSVNDLLVRAVALSLAEHPAVNAAFQDDHIYRFNDVDISIAVKTAEGLITPIIRSADTKGVVAIGREIRQLAGKAQRNQLTLEEFQGASFTISNLGMIGEVSRFSAVLNPPQAAILAIPQIRKEVRELDGQMKTVQVCALTLTVDHRVIDGAQAAEFMATVKSKIELPVQLVL